MRDLFDMDRKDYNPNGKVYARPSVRAVIVRGDEVLLMYSQKYDYYKFPGGGIEPGESHTDTLVREVQEESGYLVKPETIEEFGRVLRRERGDRDPNGIFEQENFYYFCEAGEMPGEVNLDDYEAEEGFAPRFVKPFDAHVHNRRLRRFLQSGGEAQRPYYFEIVYREERVLDLLDLEIRSRQRKAKEKEAFREMGVDGIEEMLAFVEQTLTSGNSEDIETKQELNYSRFLHTKRVLAWTKRLYEAAEDKSLLRKEDLYIAAVFHDVGRVAELKEGKPHALLGEPITRRYLTGLGMDSERIDYICSLVQHHSDKERMYDAETDAGLLLLMEADSLDDMGAAGIVMDCLITKGRNANADYTNCLDHISRFTCRQQQDNPMVSPAGIRFWEEKTKLVESFTDALRRDLEFD